MLYVICLYIVYLMILKTETCWNCNPWSDIQLDPYYVWKSL